MTRANTNIIRGKKSSTLSLSRTKRASRLVVRRRIIRRRKITLGFILFVFLFVFAVVMLRQPFAKITRIVVVAPNGISNGAVTSIVRRALTGSYVGIIPYSSIVFLNSASVRKAVLDSDPTIAAVSISRKGLSSLDITLEPRTALSQWCGTFASSTPANTLSGDTNVTVDSSCYLFDSSGFLYQQLASSTSLASSASSTAVGLRERSVISSSTALFPYTVYAPLVATGTPYLNTIASESLLPHIFDLAQNIRTFNTVVLSIVLRGDEVDFFLDNGTRITYVRGNERNAFTLLSSVAKDISLSDGSLQYVDLRFKGKVYFKKR